MAQWLFDNYIKKKKKKKKKKIEEEKLSNIRQLQCIKILRYQ